MKKIFMQELAAYTADHPEDEFGEELPIRADVKFSGKVEPGEIRLFADVTPPRSGLFYKCRDGKVWIVIPLSDKSFTVPASNQEALVCDHVYQFWNELSLPDSKAKRSYFEETASKEEMKCVEAVLRHLRAGDPMPDGLPIAFGEPITRPDDPRLKYFSMFKLGIKDFECKERFEIIDLSQQILDEVSKKEGDSYGLAAATGEDPATLVLCRRGAPIQKGEYSEEYVNCNIASKYIKLVPGDNHKVLKFKYEGELPKGWKVGDEVLVSIHERTSRKQIGTGRFDASGKAIIIDDFSGLDSLDAPILSTAGLVIVLTIPKEAK